MFIHRHTWSILRAVRPHSRLLHAAFSSASPNESSRHRVTFLGSPDVAAQVLHQLYDASKQPGSTFDLTTIVTQPARPRGRGLKLLPTPVESAARDLGFSPDQILSPERANEAPFLATLRDHSPSLCITAAYGCFLPQRFLDIPRHGTLNIHPSLLPKYRGAAPVPRAIEAGETETGVSVLYTVLKMDAGPIVARESIALDPNVQAPALLSDLFDRGTNLLLHALPSVWSGDAIKNALPQDESLATHAAKMSRDETRLSFRQPARRLHDKVRAFVGWPGTFAQMVEIDKAGRKESYDLKVLETRLWKKGEGRADEVTRSSSSTSGALVPDSDASLVECIPSSAKTILVPCGDGRVLELLTIQPPTRKVMPVEAFLTGFQGRGTRLYVKLD